VDKAEADVGSLEAQVGAAAQEIQSRKLDLEYSRVTAPIDGRASRALLTEGNLVNAGGSDPVLTTIVSIDPINAYFDIDERSVQRYQKMRLGHRGRADPAPSLKDAGLHFSFGLDSDEGYPREGVLDFVDNRVDPATGTIQVRGVIANEDGRLVAGSRVRIRVPVSEPYEAVLLPDTALLTDQDRKYVLVVGAENVVERRDVAPGRLLDDGMRVILQRAGGQGISKDDWVVVEGLQRARIHYPVDPVKPKEAAASS
jgi:multidrug efflux system membrane fusion protein